MRTRFRQVIRILAFLLCLPVLRFIWRSGIGKFVIVGFVLPATMFALPGFIFAIRTDIDEVRPFLGGNEILDRHGRPLELGWNSWLSLDEVEPWLITALLSIEDKRFRKWYHFGVDPLSVLRAIVLRVGGASGIHSQVARQIYDGELRKLGWRGSTFERLPGLDYPQPSRVKRVARKIAEAMIALKLNQEFTDDEVLELYLNLCRFSVHGRGITVASYEVFGKHPSELDHAEGLFLIACVQYPNDSKDENLVRAGNAVVRKINALVGIGVLNSNARLPTGYRFDFSSRPVPQTVLPYWVRQRVWREIRNLSNTGQVDEASIHRAFIEGDLRIRLTLDGAWQRGIHNQFSEHARSGELEMAALGIDPVDGAVQFMYGGSPRWINRVYLQKGAGSTLKLLIILAALEAGYTPNDFVDDSEIRPGFPLIHSNRMVSIVEAAERSLNAPFIRLARDPKVRVHLDRLTTALDWPEIRTDFEILGMYPTSVDSLTRLYASLETGGLVPDGIYVIRSLERKRNNVELYSAPPTAAVRIVSESVARSARRILIGVIEARNGTASYLGTAARGRWAGKTGSYPTGGRIQLVRPGLSVGIWVGFDSGALYGLGSKGTLAQARQVLRITAD